MKNLIFAILTLFAASVLRAEKNVIYSGDDGAVYEIGVSNSTGAFAAYPNIRVAQVKEDAIPDLKYQGNWLRLVRYDEVGGKIVVKSAAQRLAIIRQDQFEDDMDALDDAVNRLERVKNILAGETNLAIIENFTGKKLALEAKITEIRARW